MKRAFRLLAVPMGLALALLGTVAVAAWLSTGSASATATATTVNQANAPTATRGSGQVSLSWAASTLASGADVGGYRVVRHDGTTTTQVCTVTAPTHSCTDSTPVATAVTYGVVATIGSWTGPESTRTSFTYDNVAPTTTATVSPTPNGAGWNRTAVTVTLTATDSGLSAGVDHLSYAVDGGTLVTVAGASTSFAVSGAGSHTVTYQAVDNVGNTEVQQSRVVKIDPSAPVTSVTATPAPNAAGWSKTDVSLAFSATDTGTSTVKSITVDGVATAGSTATKTITASGTTVVSYFATDVADNVEGTKSVTVKIDKAAPTITGLDPADGQFSSSWSNLDCASQADRICATVGDTGSGVTSVSVQLYRQSGWGFADDACWNGTAWVTSACPFLPMEVVSGNQYRLVGTVPASAFTNSQPYRTTVLATDVAGNSSTAVATFKYDVSAPTASIFPDSTWRKSGLVQVSGFDPLTGTASVSYRVDANSGPFTTVPISGAPLSGSTTFTLASGAHTVDYFATDAAGNVSATVNNAAVNIDQLAPTVGSFDPAQNASGKWNQVDCSGSNSGRLCVDISDALSGIDSTKVFWSLSRTVSGTTTCWNGANFAAANCGPMLNTLTLSTGSTWRTPVLPDAAMIAGSYNFSVSVDDSAGNSTFAGVGFTVTQ